jgi:hypothetical protein
MDGINCRIRLVAFVIITWLSNITGCSVPSIADGNGQKHDVLVKCCARRIGST